MSEHRPREASFKNPARGLILRIIDKAIADWNSCTRRNTDTPTIHWMARQMGYENGKEELRAFFNSAWFKELCEWADIHPDDLRKARPELPWESVVS